MTVRGSGDVTLEPTASQTAGPFFSLGMSQLCVDHVISPADDAAGITIRGRVLDGNGLPIRDCAIEVWQADAGGTYNQTASRGFARVIPGDDGVFAFMTIRPGPCAGPGETTQAPHLVVLLFMRGLLRHLMTRLYFPDEPANDVDPVLALVPRDRRSTLIARQMSTARGAFEWDVVLQGDAETVFLEC